MLLRAIHLLSILICLLYCVRLAGQAVLERYESLNVRRREPMRNWSEGVSNLDKMEQFKLIYDYIKFHLGMYLATPPVIAIIAESFAAKDKHFFQIGLGLMIFIYLISGAHAGLFMSRYINDPWTTDILKDFESGAFSPTRRNMHHTLYWLGLALSLIGLILAILFKW